MCALVEMAFQLVEDLVHGCDAVIDVLVIGEGIAIIEVDARDGGVDHLEELRFDVGVVGGGQQLQRAHGLGTVGRHHQHQLAHRQVIQTGEELLHLRADRVSDAVRADHRAHAHRRSPWRTETPCRGDVILTSPRRWTVSLGGQRRRPGSYPPPGEHTGRAADPTRLHAAGDPARGRRMSGFERGREGRLASWLLLVPPSGPPRTPPIQ